MPDDQPTPIQFFFRSLGRCLRLRCPRCGEGRLFKGWFAMNPTCSNCDLDLEREPGFYLGSIYVNYGLTVALVGPTFAILTLGLGYPRNVVAWPCGAFTILFPLWFFRYARAIWLCLGWVSTSIESPESANGSGDGAAIDPLAEQQQAFKSDDAMAGLIIGGALVLIFLVMIALMVTVGLWTASRT